MPRGDGLRAMAAQGPQVGESLPPVVPASNSATLAGRHGGWAGGMGESE
jgi:hypothetical protein